MDIIDEILRNSRTVAVVGLSPRPDRASHGVSKYLQRQGYRIVPVNPKAAVVLGERAYPDLRSVPEPIDLVDIFRRPEFVLPVVQQAIEVGAKYVWMQDGVVNQEAAALARDAGLLVVMDNCIFRQHLRWYADTKSGA
ncbi:MAG: CoA-binding protein [SAR202 cluster bacterium]|nr:CoA-binding protein [SAR202 cluster bacterium]